MTQEYRIDQVAAGNNFRVLGPGMLPSDPTWSLEDASRIVTMLNRAREAFGRELAGATVGLAQAQFAGVCEWCEGTGQTYGSGGGPPCLECNGTGRK